MAGALNSGRNLIIELSEQTFANIVLSGLRRDETRACSNGNSVWFLSVNVVEFGVNWIQQRSDSAHRNPFLTFFHS